MERPSELRCVLYAPTRSGAARTPIFGLTAVERTVLAFLRAGVTRFLVVGDPRAAEEVARLLARGACPGAQVRALGATASLVAALGGEERFFLVRTDCQYDRRMIARFVEGTRRSEDSVLAVDFRRELRPRGHELPQVAVWSRAPHATVRMVGRGLVGADGVVIGVALATARWARELARVACDERGWLQALSALTQREPVETWTVQERWRPVRERLDWLAARRELLDGAAREGEGPIARRVTRPIALRITERLLSRDVKPWHVTFSSFGITLAAGASFAFGQAAAGGLLAQAASLLEGVDQQLARVRCQDSAFRWLYDALLDGVADAALIGGMTLYAWFMGAGHAAVVAGFLAMQGSSIATLLEERSGERTPAAEEGRWTPMRWLLLGRDGRLFLALVAGVTGHIVEVLGYLAVGTPARAGARVFRLRAAARV